MPSVLRCRIAANKRHLSPEQVVALGCVLPLGDVCGHSPSGMSMIAIDEDHYVSEVVYVPGDYSYPPANNDGSTIYTLAVGRFPIGGFWSIRGYDQNRPIPQESN